MSGESISLKIIRLSKPAISDPGTVGEKQLLSLPPTFGSIYLGQEFEALLVLNNESKDSLNDITIKAELQTTNSRFSCLEQNLELEKSKNFIIKHEIKELGIHILVCTITFNGKIQRKFYKFHVLNPLSLKLSSVYAQEGIYIQISLTNNTNLSLCLSKFIFASQKNVLDLNSLHSTIVPKEIRVYLYYLEKKDVVENLGKCDITYTLDNGSVGRLVTADLMLKNHILENEYGSLLPKRVIVEEKFTITVQEGDVEQDNYKKQILLVKKEVTSAGVELSFLALYPGFYSLKLSVGNQVKVVDILTRSKSPAELIKALLENLHNSESSKILIQIKNILYGDGEQEPNTELVSNLAQEVYNMDLFGILVLEMDKFEFERVERDYLSNKLSNSQAKKDVAQIFNNLLRRQIGTRFPTAEYIATKPELLKNLVKGYDNPDISLNCGMILREVSRHECLVKIILESDYFWKFFELVDLSTFDIASDAFSNFKEILTRHKGLTATFLEANYEEFFEKYTDLLNSENYVTKRQSLKLLGELLLDRKNFVVMIKYISVPENLKLMMNLLRDKSKNIQFEAFHVFKIFVANPKKTPPINDILYKNKEKLLQFLSSFHNDRTDDEQFNDEKSALMKQIQEL